MNIRTWFYGFWKSFWGIGPTYLCVKINHQWLCSCLNMVQSGWLRLETIFQNFGLILAYFCDNYPFSPRFSTCTYVKMHINYSGGIVRRYQFILYKFQWVQSIQLPEIGWKLEIFSVFFYQFSTNLSPLAKFSAHGTHNSSYTKLGDHSGSWFKHCDRLELNWRALDAFNFHDSSINCKNCKKIFFVAFFSTNFWHRYALDSLKLI